MLNVSNAILKRYQLQIEENRIFSFDVKHDDLIDDVISGNKWRKLEYHLLKTTEQQKTGVLTFGGAFSNHLLATAKAAKLYKIKSIGIVRGEELHENSNPVLKACDRFGMKLIFVRREIYRQKSEIFYINKLKTDFPEYYIVPEGGMSYYGVLGCLSILKNTKNDYNHIYLAGGTGTTAAGILLSADVNTTIHIVSSLKGDFLRDNIKKLISLFFEDPDLIEDYLSRLLIINDEYFGGYGKVSNELIEFINDIYSNIRLKSDPIYTGKALFKMVYDFKTGNIHPLDKTLFIHTGGLKGAACWKNQLVF